MSRLNVDFFKKGLKWFRLTFIEHVGTDYLTRRPNGGHKKPLYGVFVCDCGKEAKASLDAVYHGVIKHCGCRLELGESHPDRIFVNYSEHIRLSRILYLESAAETKKEIKDMMDETYLLLNRPDKSFDVDEWFSEPMTVGDFVFDNNVIKFE